MFIDPLESGGETTLVESYLRHAQQMRNISEDEFYSTHGEIYGAIDSLNENLEDGAHKAYALHKRNGNQVNNALTWGIQRYSSDIAAGRVAKGSVMNLLFGGSGVPSEGSDELRHSADYHSIRWRGEYYTLTHFQAASIKLLHEAYLNDTPDLSEQYIVTTIDSECKRMRDLFRNSPLWDTLVIPGKRKGLLRLNLR